MYRAKKGRSFLLGAMFKRVLLSRRWLINVFSRRITPYFRMSASISALNGRERRGAGWWAWEHCPGKVELGGWKGL